MSKKFYYRRGEIETTEPWLVPTIENFDAWLTEWKSSVDLTGFSVYLGGSFARPYWQAKNERVEKPFIETWDVDIIITGPEDYPRLRKILNEASRIGFRHHLLIDASWDDMLYDNPDYLKDPSERKKIRTNRDVLKISEFENFYWTADNLIPFGVSHTEISTGVWLYENITSFNIDKHFEKKNYTIQLV